jgi:predicted enzyme related to lactoylglutathione lyase
MSGLSGGAQRAVVVPMFRVDDIQAAVERVRAAGGTASEPLHEGYGIRVECADDQGVRFHLGQL